MTPALVIPILMQADFVFAIRSSKLPSSDEGGFLRNFARAWSFLTMSVPVTFDLRTNGSVIGEALLTCVSLVRREGCAKLDESMKRARKAKSASFAAIVPGEQIYRRCRYSEALGW